MSSSEKLKKARTYTKSRFTRAKNNVVKAIDDNASQRTVETRYNHFKELWGELQLKHEAYILSSNEVDVDDGWIENVAEDFEETQSSVEDYFDKVLQIDSKEDVKVAVVEAAGSMLTAIEIQQRQENIRFKGLCDQIQSLLSSEDEDPKDSVEVVKDFTQRIEDSKKKIDSLYNKLIEVSVKEGKDVPATLDEEVSRTEEQFNRWYGKAKIFTSKFDSAGKIRETQRGTESGIRLEKVKFNTFNGDIRKYPCFRKEFKQYIKPQYRKEEEAFVLKRYLDPEIRDDVAMLGENADEIWARLDRKYGDEGKLVDSIMTDVKNIPMCTDEDPHKIIVMIKTIERAYRDLSYLCMEQEISNSTIVSLIEQRLPKSIESEWLKVVTGGNRLAVGRDKFPALYKLLLEHKERIEYKLSEIRNTETEHGDALVAASFSGRKSWCWLHPDRSDHPIWRCKMFLSKAVEERISLVRANRACVACLEQGHTRWRCQRGFKCREGDCGKPHHTLIHVEDEAAFSFHGLVASIKPNKGTRTLLLLQEIKAKCTGERNTRVPVNCLWDSGSTLSFITFAMARRLMLRGSKVNLSVTKIGGVTEEIVSFRYNISLLTEDEKAVTVTVLGLERISTQIQTIKLDVIAKQFTHYDSAEIHRPTCGDVDVLLGLDVAGLHPVRIDAKNHLLLLRNEFGLLIGGSHPLVQEHTQRVVQQAYTHVSLTEFQDLEDLGVCCKPKCGACRCGRCHPGGSNMTLEEEREYRMIEDGLSYDEKECKWTAAYPWKRDPSDLPNNYVAAFGALRSLEKGLRTNEEYAELYRSQIEDMLDRKACRLLTSEEIDGYKGPVHYIAHHGVLKPESKSTPLRIVFNSSASFQGHVLNDYYAKGPSMLNDLLGLLLRFSQEEFAFIGDISKMYHAINIPVEDQMTHRFLWRDLKENQKPQTFVVTVVNFGDRPAGSIAIAALKKTAVMFEVEYPVASKILQDNSYMDDIIHSIGSKEEAERIMEDIDKVLDKGGFKTKSWVMSGSKQSNPVNLMAECESERVLGMLWDPSRDKLYFKVKVNFSPKKKKVNSLPNLTRDNVIKGIPAELSKRSILTQINSIYDPRGLLSPFTVRAKIIMRKLWLHDKKLQWDDAIPRELREEWVNFFVELFDVEDLHFERCLKPKGSVGDPMLVCFSDGSENAFAVVAYARWKMEDGGFESRIIASKSKIAPTKIENIVRLELCGAVLSKRLRVFIEAEMNYKFSQVVHLVDSEIVKAMIEKNSYGFRTFVANRIGEIQSSTSPGEWYWIPGKLNIADWVTRGKQPKELGEGSIWRAGPDFLKLPFKEWPVHARREVEELPERVNAVHTVDAEEEETLASRIDIDRFSNLQLLLGTTARLLKLYEIYKGGRSHTKDVSTELTSDDVKNAERFWVKEAQKELIESMKTQRFIRLTPRVKDDVIVVGGRTKKHVAPTWNNEEFVLLPYSHRFSVLVAWYMHERGGHLGVSATTAQIRSKYWIINLPRMVKTVCFMCVICRIKRKLLSGQVMAALPIDRLQPSPPFYVTGLDFFGPYCLKGEVNKRSRGKCYGLIFVCYSSRAVHVDLSADYSTDAFLQTLRRFVSIRGWPKRFRSDNGSQLVAASKELRDAFYELDHKRIKKVALVEGSEWEFSAADAPWMNGATEALVKSVKRALHTIIKDQILTFSELQTVMYESAELVNERPIGRNPTQPDDGSYLCPNNLILGRSSARVPQGPFKERCSARYRFDYVEKLVEHFWSHWIRDLFPNLVVQQKWHVDRRNLQKNDVVLIQDNNSLRGRYKMGIVTDVFPSDDGKIRSVEVSYKNIQGGESYDGVKYTSVTRPVHKLIVIVPAEEQGDDDSNN